MSFDNGWTAANKHAITHKHEGADVNDTENDYAVMHEHETEWQRQRKATTTKKRSKTDLDIIDARLTWNARGYIHWMRPIR